MPTWLTLAKGPIFDVVLTILALGLLRLILLTTWDIIAAIRRAGDRHLPYKQIAIQTVSGLFPFNRLHRKRVAYSIASFGFHIGILVVTLTLRNHIDILQANIGLSWISLSKPFLDILTLAGILGITTLLLFRLLAAVSRKLSGKADYLLLLILLNIFLTGYIAGRSWNPIPYNGLMLYHTLNGMILLALIPFSKISHCVLYPLIRLGTEVAWHFTPHGGSEAVKTLHGTQGREI